MQLRGPDTSGGRLLGSEPCGKLIFSQEVSIGLESSPVIQEKSLGLTKPNRKNNETQWTGTWALKSFRLASNQVTTEISKEPEDTVSSRTPNLMELEGSVSKCLEISS